MSFDFQVFIYKVVLTVVTLQKVLRTVYTGPQDRSKHEGNKVGRWNRAHLGNRLLLCGLNLRDGTVL